MSNSETKQVTGSVEVSANAYVGNRVNVSGNVTIGHNLKVDGWLQAPNIKGGLNKGQFVSYASLSAAWPNPKEGWVAGVGSSNPQLYLVEEGSWKAQTDDDDEPIAYVSDKGDKGDTGGDGEDASIVSQSYDANGNTVITWNDGTTTTINKGQKGDIGATGATGPKGGILFPSFSYDASTGKLTISGVEEELQRVTYDASTGVLTIKITD